MTLRTITIAGQPGGTWYAYPGDDPATYPLSAWTTHRVELTDDESVGLYQGQADDTKGLVWYVFEGASQPASFGDAVYIFPLTRAFTADEVTALNAIFGIPSSGSTPETPTTGVLADIEDDLAAIKAKTNLIGTGAAGTGGAPVADDGNLKELIIGDDYSVDNGQELQWTVNLPDNTTIAGAKCYFGGYHSDHPLADDNNWLVEGTVLEGPTASQAIIRFNFLRAINSTLAEGDYNWHAEIWNDAGLQSTRVRSKKTRRVTLVKKQTS